METKQFQVRYTRVTMGAGQVAGNFMENDMTRGIRQENPTLAVRSISVVLVSFNLGEAKYETSMKQD